MKIFKNSSSLKAYLNGSVGTVGFVPTMGALHEGHLQLGRRARDENDILVYSIYVNPTQFNVDADLENYPKTLEADKIKLLSIGCDVLYSPNDAEMYPDGLSERFEMPLDGIDRLMEGAKRPGHFEGVITVVKKLLENIPCKNAYFGLKDYQQYLVVKKLVKFFQLQTEIIGCDIVRESDGLAMSSRNVRLSERMRLQALELSRSLLYVQQNAKVLSPSKIHKEIERRFKNLPEIDLEYFEIADSQTLNAISKWGDSSTSRAFIAAQFEGVRLIDNMRIFA